MLLSHLRTSPIRIDKRAQIKHPKPSPRTRAFCVPRALKNRSLAVPKHRAGTYKVNSILNSNRSQERGPVQEPQTSTGPRYSKLVKTIQSIKTTIDQTILPDQIV